VQERGHRLPLNLYSVFPEGTKKTKEAKRLETLSATIADRRVKNRTLDFQNTKQESYSVSATFVTNESDKSYLPAFSVELFL
jgi:hypothetical protein